VLVNECRINNQRGVTKIDGPATEAGIAKSLRASATNRKVLVILGEAYDDGHIRLAGDRKISVASIRKAIPPDMRVVGLFCGSADSLSQVPGLAVNGVMTASEASHILKVVLEGVENGVPTTVEEFIKDSLIYARHRKRLLVVVGGTSVLVEGLRNQPSEGSGVLESSNGDKH
jgi:hypothetical protein